MAHDPGVAQKAANVFLGEGGYFPRREMGESGAEGGPFVEDGPPGEAGLKDLKREPLEVGRVCLHRNTPFLVMIFREERVLFRPGAAARHVGGLLGFRSHC